MIEAVILYVLNKYDLSIYRISKVIDELFFAFLKTSSGTINPALKRLEKLECVSFIEKMSDGGMKTKIYSLTPNGKKHLQELLLTFSPTNPYHILNEAKIAVFMSDILKQNEYSDFKENMRNVLELYQIKLKRNLENEFISLNEIQKNTININLDETEKLIKLL